MNDCELSGIEPVEGTDLVYQKLLRVYSKSPGEDKERFVPSLVFLSEYEAQQLNVGDNR